MRLLGADDLARALPLVDAIEPMREAFKAIAQGTAVTAERQAMPLDAGTGLVMGAALDGVGMVGKMVSVMPGNSALGLPGTLGLACLSDASTGQPLAVMDGAAFTARRTAAVAMAATLALAPVESRTIALLGCGTQATALLEGLALLPDLETVRVAGRRRASAQAFVQRHAGLWPLVACRNAADAIRDADIVITATNSESPVFSIDQLAPGAHVTAIGSFRPGMLETPPALAQRASVFVESRETAMAEAGELIEAVKLGLTRSADWRVVGEALSEDRPMRAETAETTLFKSVGHAVFDLFAARAMFDAAQAHDLGLSWDA